jgi:hypothetical protein
VIEGLVRDGTAVARSDGSLHTLFPVAVSAAEGEALGQWVTGERATQTIEIGLGYGISALFIGEALLGSGDENALHVVLDPNQATRFADLRPATPRRGGVDGPRGVPFRRVADRAATVSDRTTELRPRLRRRQPSLRRGLRRFVLPRPTPAQRGFVFLDDYQLPAVARATSFRVTNLAWTLEEVSGADDAHQWAVLRTPEEPDTRPFDYYMDF